MITERKIYITTDGIEFDEGDYPTPEKARADAEQHEAQYQHRYSFIGKELFFRDEHLNVCDYDDAMFVAVTTKEAVDTLNELCEEWGYYTPWDNCKEAFSAKTGFFMYNEEYACWIDMDMEIEKILGIKAILVRESKE
jgi:hypothetical protein